MNPDVKLDIDHGTKALLEKAASGRADKDMLIDAAHALNAIIDDVAGKLKHAKEQDPFWFYEPTSRKLTSEARALLEEFLPHDEIPTDVDGGIDVHLSTAPVKIVGGGNQSSKTTSLTLEDLIFATGELPFALKHIYPQSKIPQKAYKKLRAVCEDYTHGILNHNLPALKKWVPREWLVNRSFDDSWVDKRQTLMLVNPQTKELAAELELMSNQADVETFQGPPIDRVRYDEEPRKDIYEENLLRFVTSDSLSIDFGMTPTKGLTWVYYDLWTQSQGPNGKSIATFQLCSLSNPKANLKTLRELVGRITDPDMRKMRLIGEWVSLSGLVYGRVFKKNIHVVRPERLGLGPNEYMKCTCSHILADPRSNPMKSDHKPGCRFLNWIIMFGLDPHTVKATAAAVLALSRNGDHVLDTCYSRHATTTQIKEDLARLRHGYRYAFTKVDPHCDSDVTALDNRNIFRELKTGVNAIPNLRKGDAYKGSILAGVDVIMELLGVGAGRDIPQLVIVDRPENQSLIRSFLSLERDSWADEDGKGTKDAIREGKHDHHAAMRYILQTRLGWRPYEPLPDSYSSGTLEETAELLEA